MTDIAPAPWIKCDADCPQRAAFLATMPSGHSITYCIHHLNRFSEGLRSQGALISGIRGLVPTP